MGLEKEAQKTEDRALVLTNLMKKAGYSSLVELATKAGVSELQLIRLKQGLVLQTRVEILLKISEALKISLTELLDNFAPDSIPNEKESNSHKQGITEEFKRLQREMAEQREIITQELQQRSIEILETWLIQWPTVVAKVKENPQIEAFKLLPLVRPIDNLMREWGLRSIGRVGDKIPYDPKVHQIMEGSAQPGDLVLVRYIGYRQRDKLLYRAKVSPLLTESIDC